jgi:hypothetical protein
MNAQDFFHSAYYSTPLAYVNKTKVPVSSKGIKLVMTKSHASIQTNKQTPSESELYQSSDRRLSEKRLPTFADKGCHVVSVTDPYGRILGFLDRSRYFSIK